MRNPLLTQHRNNSIRQRFTYHRKKNPKWTIVAIIEEVAHEFYLTPCTVTKILKQMDEVVPSANSIVKYSKMQLLY